MTSPEPPPGSLSKLLGAPFGIALETADVDKFLQQKITKKIAYWSTQRLSLAGRATVINAVLLSSIYYFIAIWSGSIHAIRSVRGNLHNYLWSGSEHSSRTRVSWTDCCLPKLVGGLQLLDPEVSLNALLSKWVLYAIEPGISGLKTLLRYRIHRMKPHPKTGYWFPSSAWLMVHKSSATRGLRVWNKIISAWKRIVKNIELVPPRNADEVLSTSIWWATSFIGSNFNFSVDRARLLARFGMRTIRDLWDLDTRDFKSWDAISTKFPISMLERHHWFSLLSQIPHNWLQLLKTQREQACPSDWVGIFSHPKDTLPMIIWKVSILNPSLIQPHVQSLVLRGDTKRATIGSQS